MNRPHDSSHASFDSDATLSIQRFFAAPPERVWRYLIDPALRRQWLADGAMPAHVGDSFELIWRNDELSTSAAERPSGFEAEQRMASQVLAFDPPHTLAFVWAGGGQVRFVLEPQPGGVLMTLTHTRIDEEGARVMIGAGWHMHLDILAAHVQGRKAPSFWTGWLRLSQDYEGRVLA